MGLLVLTTLRDQETEFAKANSDYYDRINFVRERRDSELQMMGFDDENQRARILVEEAIIVLKGAIRSAKPISAEILLQTVRRVLETNAET